MCVRSMKEATFSESTTVIRIYVALTELLILLIKSPKALSQYNAVNTMCLFVDGGGWTVIQRRGHFGHSENFFREWNDYRNGFGDPYKVSHFNKTVKFSSNYSLYKL